MYNVYVRTVEKKEEKSQAAIDQPSNTHDNIIER